MTDTLGYLAAALVLATFCMRSMVALRLTAIASNVAFIAYAVQAGIHPVLALHVILLPVNAWRLMQAARRPLAPATPEVTVRGAATACDGVRRAAPGRPARGERRPGWRRRRAVR